MDMSPIDIRIALLRKGVTQSNIADKLQVNKSTVSRVVSGHVVSDRVRKAIADSLGTDVRRIWPSTYMFGSPRKKGRPKTH